MTLLNSNSGIITDIKPMITSSFTNLRYGMNQQRLLLSIQSTKIRKIPHTENTETYIQRQSRLSRIITKGISDLIPIISSSYCTNDRIRRNPRYRIKYYHGIYRRNPFT